MHAALRMLASSFLAWTAVSCSSPTPGNDDEQPPDESVEAEFELEVNTSPHVPTVAFAEWSTSLGKAELRKAEVHYVLEDGSGALVAPVDLERDVISGGDTVAFRTPLLGMKQRSKYIVHVEVETETATAKSEEVEVTSGFLTGRLPRVEVEDVDASKLYGGFTVACSGPSGGESWAFIWDGDGDVVWAYPLADTALQACTRARLSYDGRFLWVGDRSAARCA